MIDELSAERLNPSEAQIEASIRPQSLDEYVGQQALKDNLGDAYTPNPATNPPTVGGSCS